MLSEKVFEKASRSPLDNQIEFLYTNELTSESDAGKHFLQSFAGYNDKRGLELLDGKLQINDPDLFKVGRYFPTASKTTNYVKEDQGVIRLYTDWVKEDPTKKRKYLFDDLNFREVMAFPLTRQVRDTVTGEQRHEVIGFVSLHHDRFFNFSQHWRHTIHLVNNQIVTGLEQIGFIKQEDALVRRLVLHETKEEAINFTSQIKAYTKSAKYTQHELKYILELFSSLPQETLNVQELKTIQERLQNLSDDHQNKVQRELKMATGFYTRLQNKINYLPDANVYAFLGLKPGQVQRKNHINIREVINAMLSSFKGKLKSRSVDYAINIEKNIYWKANEECLHRILQNLLDNAAKYALPGSIVSINANNASLSISNYCEFDPSLTGSWPFPPGKRGVTVQNKEEGWGYGLCIAKLLCEKILLWHCNFSQEIEPSYKKQNKARFTITIIPSHS